MLEQKRKQRQRKIRARLSGTATRPRASIFRGADSIGVQLVDDKKGHTMLAVRGAGSKKGKIEKANEVGKELGEKAIALGVKEVVFDRGGYVYHGRVKAVAEGMREAGLKL